MKFEQIVTSQSTELVQKYIDGYTTPSSLKALLKGNTGRTHIYLGDDVIITPAANQQIFESHCGLRFVDKKNQVQIGNWLVYRDTDEKVARILSKVTA